MNVDKYYLEVKLPMSWSSTKVALSDAKIVIESPDGDKDSVDIETFLVRLKAQLVDLETAVQKITDKLEG